MTFATLKIRAPLLLWLRQQSVRRGAYLYETVEEMISRSIGGKTPWQPAKVRRRKRAP